jgi:hypothetical protein
MSVTSGDKDLCTFTVTLSELRRGGESGRCTQFVRLEAKVRKQDIVTEISGRFAHFVQAVGYIRPQPLPSTPFTIYHSLSYNYSTLCRLNQSNRC